MRNFVFNEIMKTRRQTLIKLAEYFEEGNFEDIVKIPKELFPLNETINNMSVYRDREILKQKIKILLGMDYEKSKDMELYEVAKEIDKILSDNNPYDPEEKYMQIIKEACDICPSGKYYVTDLCRNCVAHSCSSVCPKNAITFENNKAKINYDLCVNCGMCASACSYYAIVKLERPCERSCAVNAINEDERSAADIDYGKCVNCGACYVACPFGAVETPSDLLKVLKSLKEKKKVIAIFAPSLIAQFGPRVQIGQIKTALKKVGFETSYEVSLGADEVAREEAELLEKAEDLITTSCCPAFVEYIKKHQKDFVEKISPAPSPMISLAKKIKKENDDAVVVFIGPCIAKKKEAKEYKFVDYVITFEELGALFITKKIEPSKLENSEVSDTPYGWIFATSGGVSEAVKHYCTKELKIIKMDGLKDAKKVFSEIKKEKYDLIEGMGCEGGCIGGPGIMVNPRIAKSNLKRFTKINVD
ncbi:[FeFe] hydrogenase, group B1/B3 [Marinitoga hydrogenitolerans DSM 16785]|uniref:[FeFe] hydrogenase, group B1/B3 n=1 Tax=Marinitoga hydrogenitolerans (strain DSM 16785 / JCM 12826 / AT1271) TaxID=1122195 RepID=A0A1M4SZV9_MARH1|nr:monomeric [FeFe] hydrogenase [Marinitoga hydrogenitolerans]SHE37741.1 [FeFe] hydrogenase, group B1/B3 [Marinitoga hydrogenitolerans DSM 16785]